MLFALMSAGRKALLWRALHTDGARYKRAYETVLEDAFPTATETLPA